MKLNYKSLLFLFLAFAMVGMFSACSKEDDLPNDGKPVIQYIRITRPDASDSLIVKAGQGAMIAIIGQNLQNAREIWFNDRQGSLSPTFITNTTIITRVPTQIPTDITDKLKIVFANGEVLLHDFEVRISKPLLTNLMSEYVNAGDIATIVGDFFYEHEPIVVTFTGGAQGEVVSVEDNNRLHVRVPEGAEPGPITVKTYFGQSKSAFWFRDNRNIIAGFENTDFSGWWHGKDFIKESDAEIEAINGKFMRINRNLGAWGWFEMWVGEGTIKEDTKNIPADAFANPAKYSMKFEINTLASLTGAEIKMYMGNGAVGDRDNGSYTWKPNLNTEGEWQTVSIPFEDILEANNNDKNKFEYNPNGYVVSFHFSGPLAVNANFGLDNIRVVPTTL
ncbi:glycan-binding surface protein [Pontibacter sp. SGAir0037]|uniref:glycan-binding surface protein n=1 Tax=Pontibacter sp. SGAir0037 TaxID=2571030 RepID=UPI0010CCDF2B|nr:glycan-binding surface protein [Pontibacter sp. SGAir0037]QCR23504.1 hypothetical protein C1N53_14905 [Pontibacter sp. SGAir0037]